MPTTTEAPFPNPVDPEVMECPYPFFESLRRDAPVHWVPDGVRIPRGTLVFLSFTSANRDAAQFPNADCLDPSRGNAKTHLAFGPGIHMCVGFRLARKELIIAFRRLFARPTNIRLTPGKNDLEHLFVPTALVRGLNALHLSFDRGA